MQARCIAHTRVQAAHIRVQTRCATHNKYQSTSALCCTLSECRRAVPHNNIRVQARCAANIRVQARCAANIRNKFIYISVEQSKTDQTRIGYTEYKCNELHTPECKREALHVTRMKATHISVSACCVAYVRMQAHCDTPNRLSA